jgi:hypothetical protein
MAVPVLLSAVTGCGKHSVPASMTIPVPETGEVSVLIQFHDATPAVSMPPATQLPSTAGGFFLPSENTQFDLFRSIALEADSAGKLLVLVLPEGESFHGSRDHLVIQMDSSGVPAVVEPGIDSEFLRDSLWINPVQRQRTILELIHFLKPDIVLQVVPGTNSSAEILNFWQERTAFENITVSMYLPPDSKTGYRGWGVFTGRGIENRLLEGMDIKGFASTVRMISGLEWNTPEGGYPAMQAFFPREIE